MAKVTIEGYAELSKTLSTLSDSMFRKYARKGVNAVAVQMKKRQIANAPSTMDYSVLTTLKTKGQRGDLRRSIKTKPSSQWGGAARAAQLGIVGSSVGPRWPEGAHAHLIEFGWNKTTTAFIKDGWPVFRKLATPRQMPPNPFIRKTFNEIKGQQNRILAEHIKKTLERDLRKNTKAGQALRKELFPGPRQLSLF